MGGCKNIGKYINPPLTASHWYTLFFRFWNKQLLLNAMQLSRFWINTGLFSDREIPGDDKIHGERWENLSEGTDHHRWESQESVRLGY